MTLGIAYNTNRMPFTTKFSQMKKGPEHLYYFLLFSTNPAYAKRDDAWQSWLKMGFNLALRDGPPAAAPRDQITSTTQHTPRRIKIAIEGGSKDTLARLEKLMKNIEALRPSVVTKDAAARVKAIAGNKEVNAALIAPVQVALKSANLRPNEVEAFQAPLNEILTTLTDAYLVSVEVGANVAIGV